VNCADLKNKVLTVQNKK